MSDFSSEQKILLNQGKMLPVMEHFYTIQGEGAHSGRAAYFIRLGGCDVGCHWCDVKESWDATLHPLMDAEEIAAIAAKHGKTIIITGGEPLMWDLNILTKKLKELGCTIHVETSGSHNLRGHIDWITLSPKKVKMAITGNGNASKEQVAAMLKNLLGLKEFPTKYLDASDGLAVAVCHYFNSNKAEKSASYSSWDSFIKQNPDRIK